MLYFDHNHVTHENRKLTVHFSCFHSIVTYGIIFWGNSTDKIKYFISRKKNESIAGEKTQVPYRKIFRKFNIPPFSSAYLHSGVSFVTYLTSSSLQGFDSEQKIKFL